jgi:propanediol dehydratase small subunit
MNTKEAISLAVTLRVVLSNKATMTNSTWEADDLQVLADYARDLETFLKTKE